MLSISLIEAVMVLIFVKLCPQTLIEGYFLDCRSEAHYGAVCIISLGGLQSAGCQAFKGIGIK